MIIVHASSCVVCLDEFTTDQPNKCYKPPCGHIIHLDCLTTWFEQKQNCPSCRAPIPRKMTKIDILGEAASKVAKDFEPYEHHIRRFIALTLVISLVALPLFSIKCALGILGVGFLALIATYGIPTAINYYKIIQWRKSSYPLTYIPPKAAAA